MVLQVIQMVLPIVALLGLGMVCRRKNIFDMNGLAGLKAVVGDICLPVMLFNAFFTAHYSAAVALVFLLVYAGFGLALALVSFILFRIVPYDKGLQIALMILYALPAPFIIPLFADVGKEEIYFHQPVGPYAVHDFAVCRDRGIQPAVKGRLMIPSICRTKQTGTAHMGGSCFVIQSRCSHAFSNLHFDLHFLKVCDIL